LAELLAGTLITCNCSYKITMWALDVTGLPLDQNISAAMVFLFTNINWAGPI